MIRFGRWLPAARTAAGVGMLAAATSFCGFLAVPRMYGTLVAHDDEGYLLVSLREFLSHGHLYDRTFSQYGPFYYALFGGLSDLTGRQPTLFTGRLTQTTVWIGASVLCGIATLLLTRRWLAAVFAQLASFGVLTTLAAEPMHPGGLLCLLLAGLVVLLAWPTSDDGARSERAHPARALAVGAVLGALLLTKVNVGGFAVVALALVLLIPLRSIWPWARAGAAAVGVALPWMLMAKDLDESWARELAATSSLAVALLVVVLWLEGRADGPRLPRRWLAAGAAAVALVTTVVILATGTSVGGLVDGAFLRPLRQRSGYTLPFSPSGYLVLLLVLVALVPGYLWLRRLLAPRAAEIMTASVNGVVGLLLVSSVIGWWPGGGPLSFLALAPLLAIAPIPGDHDGARLFGRRALVAIAVFQALHVYPVAGSQLGFASFLLIPAGVIGVVDAIQVAREHLAAVGRIAVIVVPLVLIAGFVTDDRFDPGRVRDAYEAETALGLPGAGWVRGLSPQVSAYRSLTQALRRHCDTFFSIPGLNSFYIFTEEEPPTGFNVGPWMYVLTGDEQRDVVRRLRRVDRLCVLRNDDELAFWQGNRPPPDGPLVRYLEGLTYPVANVANYSVKARPLAG